ncbi:MAG: hypothetical protein IJ833_02340 [Lachnospiraceae bacterium]|nr:hypothetical protein [Lachnospiraceae bacterium]
MNGKGNANMDVSELRLEPQGTATRAECASMMMFALKLIVSHIKCR